MKTLNKFLQRALTISCMLVLMSVYAQAQDKAQDSIQAALNAKKKPVKNTFEGNYLIDNQSVIVPIKGTFEFDFQHRFGLINNGIKDMYGLYSGATIRLGFSYVPIKNLQIGFGSISDPMQVDFNVKYSIFRQTKDNSMPISVTWFSNAVIDTRSKDNFVNSGDRFSYFHQLIIARKISDKLSIQVAPNISHYNNLPGYFATDGSIKPTMKNDHVAISFSGRYKVSSSMGIIVNYDQPLTQHPMNNPHPNISFGLDIVTSAHSFQVFLGNYGSIVPQRNNYFNQNDYSKGQYLIGFNISRLWNF
jgi:hypothetical protein